MSSFEGLALRFSMLQAQLLEEFNQETSFHWVFSKYPTHQDRP